MTATDQQIRALTFLACAARPTNAPHWDEAGIAAAIAKVRHLDLSELMMAVGRAAGDRSLRTPAPIGDPSSSAWRERNLEKVAADNRKPDHWNRDEFCSACGKREGHQHPEDHTFESATSRTRRIAAEGDTEAERIEKAKDWARQGIYGAKDEQPKRPEPEPLPSLPGCGPQLGGKPDLPPEDRVGGDETSDEEVGVG